MKHSTSALCGRLGNKLRSVYLTCDGYIELSTSRRQGT